jgi:hypothetical protein
MDNGQGPSELIRRTLEPLMDERETLEGQLEGLEAQAAEKKAELRTVEKLLRQAGMIEPPTRPKGKPPSANKSYGVSDVLLGEGAKLIAKFDGEPLTIADVENGMGIAQGTARKIIDRLTEQGDLRFLGKRALSEDRPQKVMKWQAI